jgi:mannose-6-phosphate isomerase-like protein (cupin superfamily)
MTLYVPAGQGPSASGAKGKRTTFKIVGDDTGDSFGLFEHYMPPDSGGASLHYHREMIESFYVLEGELLFTVEDRQVIAGPGDTLFVPRLAHHGFKVCGGEAARILMMFSPMHGRERYFQELEAMAAEGRETDQDALLELMHRFDQYPLD